METEIDPLSHEPPTMRQHAVVRHITVAAVFMTVLHGAPAVAQTASTTEWLGEASVSAGLMNYDASGVGNAPVVALRVSRAVGASWLVLDGSLAYAPIEEQFSDGRTRLGIAETQLQVQWPGTRVRPYLGGGVGVLAYLTEAGGRDNPAATYAGAAGLRLALGSAMLLRGEMRVRIWDGTTNSAAEFLVGLGRQF